ncbi:MAG: pyrroline-5-carboxylate reductase [Bacteroidetes bacterium]|nr:pyrroline-5-carboxylate reductase [Bacteroidota bacterium]
MVKKTKRGKQGAQTLAIIGVGKMGQALLSGLQDSKHRIFSKIVACDVDTVKLNDLKSKYSIEPTTDVTSAVRQADVIFLAVKPSVALGVLQAMRSVLRKDQVLVSIVAGLEIRTIEHYGLMAVVRAMPNIAAVFGMSATAIAWSERVTEHQKQQVLDLFATVGKVVEVHEGHMDVVTGLSGSGPAYILLVAESMIDAGVKLGLTRPIARQLVTQTILGTGALLAIGNAVHPAEFREDITTPGGTTIHGLFELETAGVRAAFMRAVEAAALRSEELRKKL